MTGHGKAYEKIEGEIKVKTRIIPPENQCGSLNYLIESTLPNGVVLTGCGKTLELAISNLVDSTADYQLYSESVFLESNQSRRRRKR